MRMILLGYASTLSKPRLLHIWIGLWAWAPNRCFALNPLEIKPWWLLRVFRTCEHLSNHHACIIMIVETTTFDTPRSLTCTSLTTRRPGAVSCSSCGFLVFYIRVQTETLTHRRVPLIRGDISDSPVSARVCRVVLIFSWVFRLILVRPASRVASLSSPAWLAWNPSAVTDLLVFSQTCGR